MIDVWDAVPDTALLERVLAALRQWNPEPRRLQAPGAEKFGATCRRDKPGDPTADLSMPQPGDPLAELTMPY